MDIVLALFPAKGNLDAFLRWLRALDIDKEEKKHILMMWCDAQDVILAGDMVKRVGID